MGGKQRVNVKKVKNKEFLKWMRSEPCVKRDNLISTDWHERLEKIPMFVPTYAKCEHNMAFIMSMEYGRIWQKEKDEWFKQIFKQAPKQNEMSNRKKKLRTEFLEAKRLADINIKERKERRAKELEAKKAKAEAEAQERARKIKARFEKITVKKKDPKKQPGTEKKETETKTETEKKGTCPKGWQHVELTITCDCAENKEKADQEKKNDTETDQPKKVEDKQQEKAESIPCTPECIQVQIAKAAEKMREEKVPDECDQCNENREEQQEQQERQESNSQC